MRSLLFALLLLAGCQGVPTNYRDSIGIANISLTSLAQVTHAACGNLEPGGDCAQGALIDRSDVDKIRIELLRAGTLLDAAAIATPTDAITSLEAAQRVLIAVEAILREKGVSAQ